MSAARRSREAGGALVLVLIISFLILGFSTSFLSRGMRESRAGAGYRALGRARLSAEALLEQAKTLIRSAATRPDGRNVLVEDVLASGEVRRRADSSPAVNEIGGGDYRMLLDTELGTVWITRLEGDYLRLEAEAASGMETAFLSVTLVERLPVCAAQRFVPGLGLYPGADALRGAEEPFRNGDVLAVTPPPDELADPDALDRREEIPPVPAPGTVPEGDRAAESIYDVPMPDDGTFARLRAAAGPSYRFEERDAYLVELLGDTVRIEAFAAGGDGDDDDDDDDDHHGGHGEPPVVELPLPVEGVVYIAGDVLSLRGLVNSRVTLAVTGSVHITGSIQYVDGDGDPAMLGGTEEGPSFAPNPDYDGDSVLGVVARGSIFYAPALPPNTEIDAALFSQTGTIGLQMLWLDPTFGLNESGFGVPIHHYSYTARGKASLKELGSKASNGLPCTSVEGTDLGFGRTVSLYDRQLLDRPPPAFPTLPITAVSAVRRVGGVEGLVDGASRIRTRRTADRIPAVAHPESFEAVRQAVRESSSAFGVNLGGD